MAVNLWASRASYALLYRNICQISKSHDLVRLEELGKLKHCIYLIGCQTRAHPVVAQEDRTVGAHGAQQATSSPPPSADPSGAPRGNTQQAINCWAVLLFTAAGTARTARNARAPVLTLHTSAATGIPL
jgi:hypothetical protein